ncbi:MAG: DsbA family protein [Acholeplasmataceae bacterium]
MRIELWLDFKSEESYLLHLELKNVFEKHNPAELEVLYRSYPIRETKDETIPAHRLAHYAKRKDKAYLYHQAVFKLCFEENQPIDDPNTLILASESIGLPINEVNEILNSNEFYDTVQQNFENALLKGITSIPHLRINGTVKRDGLIKAEEMVMLLKQKPIKRTTHCVDGVCRRSR